MNAAGDPVKRRAITKYRMMANIPSSREGKEGAIKDDFQPDGKSRFSLQANVVRGWLVAEKA